MDKIIERDFFPDLPKLQLQTEYVDALNSNDIEKLRAIELKLDRGLSVRRFNGKITFLYKVLGHISPKVLLTKIYKKP